MSPAQFASFWRDFVASHAGRRNRCGQLVLGDAHRARLWGYAALRDAGWPGSSTEAPEWVAAEVRDRRGRCLRWRVFTSGAGR